MAKAEQITRTVVEGVTLQLTAHEAGVLRNLLTNHVGGPALTASGPLGRIREALKAARAEQVALRRSGPTAVLDLPLSSVVTVSRDMLSSMFW